jgi:hypothetical protein
MTEHEMKNIGNGNSPDAPLWYIADLRIPSVIGTFRASCWATSEEDATLILASATFYANETPVRTLETTVENLRLQ